ncbi:MAG: hypothetical protein FWG56_11890 [Desulfovibrionaceae bacterium]|jgi:hypothetical protein|nr:hypothetical protein [Desulfovibrionaceae bacterium]
MELQPQLCYSNAIMPLPLFFPLVRYVKTIDRKDAITLELLCAKAGTACKAFGQWTQRPVILRNAGDAVPWIHAEPGDWNAVEVGAPPLKTDTARARWALGALAFALFDGVARASIAGAAWARIERPRGRLPGTQRPRSSAERVRRARALRRSPPAAATTAAAAPGTAAA